MSRDDRAGAEGGGYWNPRPGAPAREGVVEVRVRGAAPLTLATQSHTFSPRRLDPGTALLLEALLAHFSRSAVPAPERIADLGAGYGPIGLILARRFPDAAVDLVEANARAAEVARDNARRLGLERARVRTGDANALWPELGPYDLVVTNPPIRAGRAVYAPWLTRSAQVLRPRGAFWFVCRTAQGATTLKALLAAALGNAEVVARRSGYRVVRAERDPT